MHDATAAPSSSDPLVGGRAACRPASLETGLGSVLECHIKIDKSWLFTDFFDDLIATVDIPEYFKESVEPVLDLSDPMIPDIPDLPEPPYPGPDPTPELAPLSIKELGRIYRAETSETDVEPQRFAFREIHPLMTSAKLDATMIVDVDTAVSEAGLDLGELVGTIEDTTSSRPALTGRRRRCTFLLPRSAWGNRASRSPRLLA